MWTTSLLGGKRKVLLNVNILPTIDNFWKRNICVCVCVCVYVYTYIYIPRPLPSLLVFFLNIQFEALLEIHLMIICRTLKLGLEVTVEIPSNPIVFQLHFRYNEVKVAQSCPILCDSMDWVPGILQARILEWVAFPFSRASSQPWVEPRSPALQADSLPSSHQGSLRYRMKIKSLSDFWAKNKIQENTV